METLGKPPKSKLYTLNPKTLNLEKQPKHVQESLQKMRSDSCSETEVRQRVEGCGFRAMGSF